MLITRFGPIPGKTAKSILISCGARLAVFDIQELRELTAYDELELDTLGDKKTALFLIMSDTDSTFNFLISMAYTQLFNLFCEKADDVYGGRLPVHVRCLIDEMANIGQIPNLEKLIATIRSREISVCLVLQARSQLKSIYKDNADTIIGNSGFVRKNMVIQQIRNATLIIKYGGITFLIDPWFQDQGTGFSAKAVKPEMQGIKCPMNALPDAPKRILTDVDYCLVTHLHFDHFSLDYLPVDLRIIAQNDEDAEKIREMGFAYAAAFESDSLTIGGVVIHKTKAIHGDSEEIVQKMGEVCGYVFEAPREKCLYLAADTIYCPEVEQTIRSYHPEVMILNCCEATTPLGRLIMNLSDVEKVCQAAPHAIVMASHLDSVNHALLTRKDIKVFADRRGLSMLWVPEDGECTTI